MKPKRSALVAAIVALLHGASHATPCPVDIELPKELAARPLTFLGEIHGTTQIPLFVQNFVCGLAKRDPRVVLALEFPKSEQHAIDRFLTSQGNRSDEQALLSSPFWSRPVNRQDGRTSKAMLSLLDGIRRFNRENPSQSISVAAIEDADDLGMSKNIRALLEGDGSNRGMRVVVLTGDIHARLQKGNEFDPDFKSAGYFLRDLHPISLVAEFDTGTAWGCLGRESCKALVARTERSPLVKRFGVLLQPPSHPRGFDGTFYVGTVEASEPAVLVNPPR